uniref:Uncharacterized protein n=1 Tax=Anopheles dirus TaxID=7168 RepID=A0A182MYA6_9DIPT
MKVKQSKKQEDFQNMSLDNFLDNMDADVGDDEPEVKPKSKLKSNGIEKSKTKKKDGAGAKLKKPVETPEEPKPVTNGVDKKKPKKKSKSTDEAPEPELPVKMKKAKAENHDSEQTGKEKKKKRKLAPPEDDGASSDDDTQQPPASNGLKKKKKIEKGATSAVNVEQNGNDKKKKRKQADDEDAIAASGLKAVEKEHQQALARLEKTDPELFAFLKKNDEKLLQFGQMGGDSDESGDEAASDEEGAVHELPDKLEVASDESDFDPDEDEKEQGEDGEEDDEDGEEDGKREDDGTPGRKVTFKMLKMWTNDLVTVPLKHVNAIRNICRAFNSAIYTVTGDKSVIPPYRVEGSALFNGIVQTCVLHLGPAVRNYLGLNDKRQFKDLKNDRRFKKVRACLKTYLIDLTNLLENVSSSHIMSVLLKHLHQFSSILVCYQNITKPILKRLIVIWSTAEEETIRVLAFMCILKITHAQQSHFLSSVLKAMYLAYVKNTKFVSPSTLPNINFMRRSLAEMFLLNFNLSYQHMFMYIRQLAIHLRNAVVLQKKDSLQYIYNWQYINSMKLWADVLGAAHAHGRALEPLIYPFVSIAIGVIKLIPSAQYFPLRFHCCRMLIQLSAKTGTFIPVLPFLAEVLRSHSFNEDHKKLSMRPVNLTCLLRFSPANIQENAFKDAVIDLVYELVLEFAANESASISFPEMVLPIVLQLRQYAKATKKIKYGSKIKQLSDKLMENYEFMEKRRSKVNIPLLEADRIRAWEEMVRAEGTPLAKFHASVSKETESVKRRQATDSEKISDYKLPTLKKLQKKAVVKQDGPVTLFPSDDEDEDDEIGFGEGEEGDDESMSDGEEDYSGEEDEDDDMGDEDEDDDDEEDDEDEEEDDEDEEVLPQKRSKKKLAKEQKKPPQENFPLEDGHDADQVDIVKDLNLTDWDD